MNLLTTEQRLQRLEDEAAIRDLAARFADAGTRNDTNILRSLFTPDAVFTIGEPASVTCHGVDEIVALIHKLEDNKDFFVQFVHSGLVQIDGREASARWLLREVAMGAGESGAAKSYYNNFGFFNDELEKIDERWFFRKRTYSYMYLDTDPFNGKAVPLKHEVSFT